MYVRIACIFKVLLLTPANPHRSLTERRLIYDCAMESEAVAHASCVEVTSGIRRYHAYQDVWQPFVSAAMQHRIYNLSVRIPNYRGVRISGVSLNTLST